MRGAAYCHALSNSCVPHSLQSSGRDPAVVDSRTLVHMKMDREGRDCFVKSIKVLYVMPKNDREWCVSRQGDPTRTFLSKRFAMDYARLIARQSNPSAIVELTSGGDPVAWETFE